MPHAVFLHSALQNDRVTDPRVEVKKNVLRLHQAESIIMFRMAGLVNAAIKIMAAAAFYPNIPVPTIDVACRTLLPLFGPPAAVIFGITLLSSGLSSSTTGHIGWPSDHGRNAWKEEDQSIDEASRHEIR